jgi:hypothetical protein
MSSLIFKLIKLVVEKQSLEKETLPRDMVKTILFAKKILLAR